MEQTEKMAILETAANIPNDPATSHGAELDAHKETKQPEKTAAEEAEERKVAAKKKARKDYIEQYKGKPAALLAARTVTENKGGKQSVSDFSYEWEDENGVTVSGKGKVNVTTVMSGDAAANYRDCAARVQSLVVDYHNAEAEKRANIRNKAAKDIEKMFALIGAPRKPKKSDVADVLDSAYFTNANGDDDAAKETAVSWTVQAITRRIIKGREEKANADATRKDAKAKQEAEKKAA